MSNVAFYVPGLKAKSAWLDWRGQYPAGFDGFGDRALSEVRYSAMHHSVTSKTGSAKKDCDTLYRIHSANGWGMIGYHIIVTSEYVNGFAKAAIVGDIGSVRAHTPNTKGAFGLAAGLGNRYIIATCVIGMNHLDMPDIEQLRTMYLIQRELLWFEDARLPNLWNTWDDCQAHKVFDYTQCNGRDVEIRASVIRMEKDEVVRQALGLAKTSVTWQAMDTPRIMLAKSALRVIDLTIGKPTGDVIQRGRQIAFVQKKVQAGKTYLRSKWSRDRNKNWGIDLDLLGEIPRPVPPVVKPPEPTQRTVTARALGESITFKLKQRTPLYDVTSMQIVKGSDGSELWFEVGTVYEGWSKLIVNEGKSNELVFVRTRYSTEKDELRGAMAERLEQVVVQTPAVPVELPPHVGVKPPADPVEREAHDKLVKQLEQNQNIIFRFFESVAALLKDLLNSFKR